MNKQLLQIADKENLTMQEVRTVLQVNSIINRNAEPYEIFKDKPLGELWETIPKNKIESCIKRLKEMNK